MHGGLRPVAASSALNRAGPTTTDSIATSRQVRPAGSRGRPPSALPDRVEATSPRPRSSPHPGSSNQGESSASSGVPAPSVASSDAERPRHSPPGGVDRRQAGRFEPVAALAPAQDRLRIIHPEPGRIAAGPIDGARQIGPEIEVRRRIRVRASARLRSAASATTAVITSGPRFGP